MAEFYLQIRLAHVNFVCCSGSVFAARGLMVLTRVPWARHPALRRTYTPAVRLAAFVAALLVFLFIASVAYWHDPRGVFAHLVTSAPG